jgi:hypothetical protein
VAVYLIELKPPGTFRVERLGQFVQSLERSLGIERLDSWSSTSLPLLLEQFLQLFRHPRQGMCHAVEFEGLQNAN